MTIDHNPASGQAQAEPDTRQKLLRAAVHVFARKGFEGATVRDICRRAKTNVAAVNYHFGDKQRLYAAVLEHIFVQAYQDIPPEDMALILDETADPLERLRTYIRAFFHWIYGRDPRDKDDQQCADMGAVYIGEMARPTKALDGIVERWIVPEIAALRSVLTELLGPDTPEPLMRRCMSSIVGQIMHYAHSRPVIERLFPDTPAVLDMLPELVDHVVTFTLGGLEAVRAESDTETQS